ncbi:hypothetical protein HOC37_05120 [bacterium]|jgi:hypothetical protein|nr:hypothetical protein [bacterium]MBT4552343.1 hypothetical protein [bacterium]MBT5988975.1 hypothetical protein [bacterium]
MFTKNESALEKYIDYEVYLPPLAGEKWRSFFDKIIEVVLEKLDHKFSDKEQEIINEQFSDLSELLIPLLDTPRLIKKFGRHFLKKFDTPAGSVNIIDFIGLVALQTINPQLYIWIAKNRKPLIDPSTAENLFSLTESFKMQKKKDYFENRFETIKKELEELEICSPKELALLKFCFFRHHDFLENYHHYRLTQNEPKITDNQFFCNFFYYDDLPEIAKRNGKSDFINKLKTKTIDKSDIVSELNKNRKELKRNDLISLFHNKIREIIKEVDRETSLKLLIAYGIFAKELGSKEDGFGLSEKTKAAFSIWVYVEKNMSATEQLNKDLIEIIKEENISHEFLANLIFRSFNKERRPIELRDVALDVEKIKEKFNERCENIFYDTEGQPLNIFNKSISDDPFGILYRWRDANDSKEVTQNYLEKLFKEKPEVASKFLKRVFSSDKEFYQSNIKDLNCIIDIKKLLSIINKLKINCSEEEENMIVAMEEYKD